MSFHCPHNQLVYDSSAYHHQVLNITLKCYSYTPITGRPVIKTAKSLFKLSVSLKKTQTKRLVNKSFESMH